MKNSTARKLLGLIYRILRDGRTYHEMEKIADLLSHGKLGNCLGQ
jgi:hypothetical protein